MRSFSVRRTWISCEIRAPPERARTSSAPCWAVRWLPTPWEHYLQALHRIKQHEPIKVLELCNVSCNRSPARLPLLISWKQLFAFVRIPDVKAVNDLLVRRNEQRELGGQQLSAGVG